MDQVITNFANIAGGIVSAVIKSIPAPDTPAYFIMLGTMLLFVALLFVWLLIRLRRARLAKAADAAFAPAVTFEDISAEAAATQREPVAEPDMPDMPGSPIAEMVAETPPTAPEPQAAGPDVSEAAVQADADAPAGESGEAPSGGFRFFKRKPKTAVGADADASPDDDVFLLGLEQEMLATRQLYLDGLITKEVYVTETRALYDKAQSRMS